MKKKFLLLIVLLFGVVFYIIARENNRKVPANIVFIGDSIMHSSKKYIAPNFENPYFDTKIGRQFSTLPGIVSKLKEQDGIKTALVVHLGTNGKFKEEDFDYVVEMADGKDIFIINTVHKDPWEKEVNQLLAEKVEQYRQKRKKIYLIDWYSYAKNERKYFYKDRTHLNDAGQKFYADFITSEIKKHYSEK